MKRMVIITIVSFMAITAVDAQINNDSINKKHGSSINNAGMEKQIPSSLKEEHKELFENLERFTKLPGSTGAAAREVARVLHPHFIKEEEFALPPLGYLPDLAIGKRIGNMDEVITMSNKLKEDWQQMLSEHQTILHSLQNLAKAARDEHKPEVLHFIETLKLHAKSEEEVLYPAAILVGEYLKQIKIKQ